jgi:hypothetical protein
MNEAFSRLAQFITPDQEEIMLRKIGHVGVNAVWGATGVGKSALLRYRYYLIMAYSLKLIEETDFPMLPKDGPYKWPRYERFGWVDVTGEPFDLAEFSRRLLLDFHSNDPREMEKAAVAVIQGHNPIQCCYEIIRRQKCLVVVDGLRSTRDWDSIKQAFWCHQNSDSCIFVITTDKRIAEHCFADDPWWGAINHITPLDDTSALNLFKKVCLLISLLSNSRYIYVSLPACSSISKLNYLIPFIMHIDLSSVGVPAVLRVPALPVGF